MRFAPRRTLRVPAGGLRRCHRDHPRGPVRLVPRRHPARVHDQLRRSVGRLHGGDFFTSGPTLALFDAIFRHVEGYRGLPDLAAVKAFIYGAQQTAAAYARNYAGTVKEILRAQRVNAAFQQVLDNPEAAEALQHPALKPLLDEAAE